MVKFVFSLFIALYAISGRANDLRVTYDINTKKLVLETPSSGKKVDLVLLEKPLRIDYCLIQYTAGESVLFLNVVYDSFKDHFYQLIQPGMEGKDEFVDLGELRQDEFDPFLHCSSLEAYCMKDLDCPLEEGSHLLKYVHCFTCRFEEYELEESTLQDGKMIATIKIDWVMPEVVKRAYKKRYPKGIPPQSDMDLRFIRECPWFWLDGYPLHTPPRPFDLPSVPLRSAKGGHVYIQVGNKPLNVPLTDKDEVVVMNAMGDLSLTSRGLSSKDRSVESTSSSSSSSDKVICFGQGTLDVTPPETTFKFPRLQVLPIIQKNF